jgi:hypothetical protein
VGSLDDRTRGVILAQDHAVTGLESSEVLEVEDDLQTLSPRDEESACSAQPFTRRGEVDDDRLGSIRMPAESSDAVAILGVLEAEALETLDRDAVGRAEEDGGALRLGADLIAFALEAGIRGRADGKMGRATGRGRGQRAVQDERCAENTEESGTDE